MLLPGAILLYLGGAGFTFLSLPFEETTWKLTRTECALWTLVWPVYWFLILVAWISTRLRG